MQNFILIGILILILSLSLLTLLKRAGRKGCCGSGSDYKPKRKKLKHVVGTKSFAVGGMHCQKCANRVEEVVNDIPGIVGRVDLKKGILTVSYERDVSDELILSRIERVGYTVTRS